MKTYFKYISAVLFLTTLFVLASEGMHHHEHGDEKNHCSVCEILHSFIASDTLPTHTGHFIPLKGLRLDTLEQKEPTSEIQNQNSDRAPPSDSNI